MGNKRCPFVRPSVCRVPLEARHVRRQCESAAVCYKVLMVGGGGAPTPFWRQRHRYFDRQGGVRYHFGHKILFCFVFCFVSWYQFELLSSVTSINTKYGLKSHYRGERNKCHYLGHWYVNCKKLEIYSIV